MEQKLNMSNNNMMGNEIASNDDEKKKAALLCKANLEMIESLKKQVMERHGGDSNSGKNIIEQLKQAENESLAKASNIVGTSTEQLKGSMSKMVYNELTEEEKVIESKKRKKESRKSVQGKMKKEDKEKTGVLSELKNKLNKLKAKKKEDEEKISKPAVDLNEEKEITNTVPQQINAVDKFSNDYDDFDPRSIPSYIQYDIIPLPSKGECYSHKKSKLPVAYLTASDENLITSINMYNDGTIVDTILERKILDDTIRVKDLCKGDRDAITIWLRATAYGANYPVTTNYKGTQIDSVIDLSKLKYLDFDLKGDENGWFEYVCGNGDVLKYRYLTASDEKTLFDKLVKEIKSISKTKVMTDLGYAKTFVESLKNDDGEDILDAINIVKEWINNIKDEGDGNSVYTTGVTDRMLLQTMSVNGMTDKVVIKNYIDNMLLSEATKYREYIKNNTPGVDTKVTIEIPESLGGGSFESFLSIGETIFTTI